MKNIVFAVLAGFAIGLLLAPAKGSETWKKVKDNFDDLSDDVSDGAEKLLRDGKHAVNTAKSEAERVASDVRAAARS